MNLVLDLNSGSEDQYRILLKNGESISLSSETKIALKNPDAVSHLIPQGDDILVLGKDGSTFLLVNFANAEWDIEPQLTLESGPLLTWQSFWDNLQGDENANSADKANFEDASERIHPLEIVRENAAEQELYRTEATTFRDVMKFMSIHGIVLGGINLTENALARDEFVIEEFRSNFQARGSSKENDEQNQAQSPDGEDIPELPVENLQFSTLSSEVAAPENEENTTANQPIEQKKASQEEEGDQPINPQSSSTLGDAPPPEVNGEDETEEIPDEEPTLNKEHGEEPQNEEVYTNYNLTLSQDAIEENLEGAVVGQLGADNMNRKDAFIYEVANDSSGLFEIIGNSIRLKEGVSLDYEAHPEPYTLTIRSIDDFGNEQLEEIQLWPVDSNDAPTLTSTNLSQNEDTSVSFSPEVFEASFADQDGDTLDSIRIDSLPTAGRLTLDGSEVTIGQVIEKDTIEQLTFIPDENWNGQVSFGWSASDGSVWSSSPSTVTIDVEAVNDTPVATVSIGSETYDIDAIFNIQLPARAFIDPDNGDTLTYSADLPHWLSIDAETGELMGTPTFDSIGTHEIAIVATDNSGESDTIRFEIDIENFNDAPTVKPISDISLLEDAPIDIDLTENFTDLDTQYGDILTFTGNLSNGDPLPSWLVLDPETGKLSGTPGNDDLGLFTIEVTASDGEESASDSFTISVTNTNDAPELVSEIEDQTIDEDTEFSLDVSGKFVDIDANTVLTYEAIQTNGSPLPEWLEFDSQTGELTGTPENGDIGGISIIVTASDGSATASEMFNLEVENVNDAPTVSVIDDTFLDEDSLLNLELSEHFTDQDLGDSLTYSATLENGNPLPNWLTLDSETGLLSGTPENGDVGELTIVTSASDGQLSVSNTFKLTVENTNDAPIVTTEIADQSVNEDAPFNLDASEAFDDQDLGNTLSFQATLSNGDPLPNWLSLDPETGVLSGTPGNNDVGSISLSIQAFDGQATISDTFSLTIENTQDTPVLVREIQNATTNEDTNFSIDVSASFTEEDLGDILNFSAELGNGDPLPDWLSLDAATGKLSGTPENSDVGTISVTVTASDGEASVSDSFEITVEGTNDAPTVTTTFVDLSIEEEQEFRLDVSKNFEDEDLGDSLTYSATLSNGDSLPNWISINPNTGELSGTPENEDVGDISITVTVSDGEETASDSFTLSIENTNDGPVVTTSIEDIATNEDESFSLNISGNFSDQDLGDTLTYGATLENGDPLPDWISINSKTGELTGTPKNGDIGEISITVTASDGEENVTDTFSLSVENTNDTPTVTHSFQDTSISEDSVFTLNASSNFADHDLGDSLTFSATLANGDPLPEWLSIDFKTGEISGTPENGDIGELELLIKAFDGQATASDFLSLSIENTNDGPVVISNIEDRTINEDSAFNLDISGNFADEDIGDTLTYSATLESGDPLPDWITINTETGELSGTPENEDVETLAITVSASDGEETINDTFSLTIENTNDGPIVITSINDVSTNEDSFFSLNTSDNFSDEDIGDILTYSAELENGDSLPEWISIDAQTGELSGIPENGDVGDISITVTASDGEESVSDTFTISVQNTNDGPSVTTSIADQSTNEDSPFSLDISGNFIDQDLGDSLSFSATLGDGTELPEWISINPNTGEITGTPLNGDVENLEITVSASDGEASISDTFVLTVENTNDGPIVITSISDQSIDENSAFTLDVSDNFADEDLGDTLTYSATLENGDPLPEWISIDSETGELSGTPENEDVGNISVTVTASDGEESASDTFTLTVENSNDGPTVSTSIENQSTDEDSAFSLDVSGNFSDQDLGDTLTYSATLENGDPLPDWISLDESTGILSGTPRNEDIGSISIKVTATDLNDSSVSDVFNLNIENENDGLIVSEAISDQFIDEDDSFSLDVSPNFFDADIGETITYSASLDDGSPLPDWITIDSETGKLTGTPGNNDVGLTDIKVTATDSAGATASDTFEIVVENTNDGPTAISLNNNSVDENSSSGTVVATLSTDDVDANDSHSYQFVDENGDPVDSDIFEIVDNNIQVKSGADLNHESADSHSISIRVTDSAGETHVQDFTIDVNDLNEAPSNINFEAPETGGNVDATVSGSSIKTSNGGGQGTATIDFNGSESGSEEIIIEFAKIDNSFQLEINGQPITDKIIQLQSNVYDSDTENFLQLESGNAISSPWIKSEDGSPRIKIIISEDNIEILATPTSASTEYESMQLETGDFTIPPFNDGENTLTIINPDGDGPDGLQATVTATYTEPSISTIEIDENGDTSASVLENVDGAIIANLSADDQDIGDTAIFSIEEDSSGLFEIVDGALKLKEGTSLDAESDGPFDLSIQVEDSSRNITTKTITINAASVNEGPTVSASIADAFTDEDSAFSLDVSSNFSDEDLGDTLTYSATLENGDPLPGWITIDSDTGELSGTPENGDVGDISITVTASDGEESASDTFTITVENTNDGPTVNTESTETLWEEDFSGLADGTTSNSGSSTWTTDESTATQTPVHGVENEAYKFSVTTSTQN
ncbi:putative Ig domain-containing protein, partial [Puniceicoccaceae bacterium K14]|nr:putative Ig domain-containing protein [Puniceicoccaceae bacterium K14]